jgi:transcriptional regulator with XRE-family HTH domain
VQVFLYTTLKINAEVQMERIRQLRKERNLSQAKLAVMADMDPATLNRLERGTGNPNLKTLERVADALGVEVADFFPKAQRRSSLEPSLLNGLGEERRPRYLNAWRAFVWKLVQRWEEEPPQTGREIAVVLDTMQVLVDEGAFEQPKDQITTSDWRTASEGIDLQALFFGLQRLNEIADDVEQDDTAQHRRELLEALPGGLSA